MTVAKAPHAVEDGNKQETSGKTVTTLSARNYQLDLISVATSNNVIISLATGAGKTLIAAEVIRRKIPELREQQKAVVFLAPTNPLVAQQCDVALGGTHGFIARAYHGAANSHMSSWDRARWEALVAETDVFVMTPDVLLHTFTHGVFRMSDIGLLVFDEAHHCKSDHPYNQLLQDFYHPLDPSQRPQILGLTASPDGVEPDSRRRKGRPLNPGLQHNMNSYLITVPAEGPLRSELSATVPWPSTELLTYQAVSATGVTYDSLTWLNWMKERLLRPAKRCEQICEMLRRQELLASAGYMEAGLSTDVFEGFAEGGRVSALDKQIRGVLYCLENLGPWCAAAAAFLDLLAPPEEAEVEGELLEEQLDDPVWSDDEDDDDDDSDDPGLPVITGGDSCCLFDDELGGPPEQLLQELRHLLGGIVDFLRNHAEEPTLSFIITHDQLTEATTLRPQDLPAAAAAAEATRQISEAQFAGELGGIAMAGMATCAGGTELEWCARGVLRLSCRVALLITMNVLADVLVDDKELKQQLMKEAGERGVSGSGVAPHLDSHARGSLQGFAEVLLRRVPFSLLEEQIWPELYQARPPHRWHGPPLITDKVVKLLRLLDTDRQRCIRETADRVAAAAAAGGGGGDDVEQCSPQVEDWWGSMVFVETKLSALVLSKLLSSLPHMRLVLRSGYLLGDTRNESTAGGLAMNNKQQAQVVAGFRTSAINVLVATSVGSEGMDFKQCQLVVAFDLPKDVTSYIQCRGRGRKAGSKYCFLQQEEHKQNIRKLISRADQLEARVRQISTENRKLLDQHTQQSTSTSTANGSSSSVSIKRLELRNETEPIDRSTRLTTGAGAVVTLRLAQQMLAEYCAKLPGSDRSAPLRAYYSTRFSGNLFHTVVYLPSNAGIHTKVEDAPPGLSSKQAKQHAALQVLRLLYQAGKVNDHLQPVWITQKHHKQLEAEAIPDLTSELRIRSPIHPRHITTAWQHQHQQPPHMQGTQRQQQLERGERTLVLHLHTFVYGRPKQDSTSAQHPAAGPPAAAAASTVSDQQRLAEFSLLSAVIGSDAAVAALPGGPTVTGDAAAGGAAAAAGGVGGGMCGVTGRVCWGVLLWERISHDQIMQWPVWIDKQLYVMDIEYVGRQVLTESQVNQLLGYQQQINKLVNWDKTRAQWLRTARELDKQEEEQAAAAAAIATATSAAAGSVPAAAGADASVAAAAAAAMDIDKPELPAQASSINGVLQQQQLANKQSTTDPVATTQADLAEQQQQQPEEQVQRQQVLPFKPDLLRGLMHWERGQPQQHQQQQQQQQQDPAAAAAAAAEPQNVWSPPDRLSYLIVPITGSSGSTAAAAAPAAPDLASVRSPVVDLGFENNISNLGDPAGDLTDQMTGGGKTAAAAAAAANPSSSNGQAVPIGKIRLASPHQITVDWSLISFMSSGLIPLSHYISSHLSLQKIPEVSAERMELPPAIPPEPIPDSVVAAAAAAGEPVPLTGAAAMAAVHPRVTHAQVVALEEDLKGRIVVAGHSSHVYTALGIASGLTPATSLSESIMRLAQQLGVNGSNEDGGISHLGVSGAAAAAAAEGADVSLPSVDRDLSSRIQISNPAGTRDYLTGDQPNPASQITPKAVITNLSNSWGALLSSKNPDLAAAVMLSSSMMQHDPDQRPMLGWKVGKTDQGSPIWESVDRHNDYYWIRSGITGLRSDLPMLAVKSSRGLTDSCLVPPKQLKNVICMPAAAAGAGSEQVAAAAAAADGATTNGTSAAAAAAGRSVAHKRPASDTVACNGTLDNAAPDKRRRTAMDDDVSTAAAAAAAAEDPLDTQQQSGTPCFTTHELPTPEAVSAECAQLADMSRSGRRKVWAQHRVMFLPLELVWLLPITSSAWSQLQLIPNIIYRLDSMLQAVGMHDQLRELLHGGGAAAAAAKGCAGPDREDLQVAAAGGWQQPAAMHDLMSGVSNRELLSQQDDDIRPDNQAGSSRPGSQAAAAAASSGAHSAEAAAAAGVAAPLEVGTGVVNSTVRSGAPQAGALQNGTIAAAAAAAAVNGSSSVWCDVPLPSPTLLLVSMTASSCQETFDLERLEFLGDVILKVLTSHVLIKAFPPDANEGELSVAKARIIRNLRLAQLGRSSPLYLQYQLRSFPYDNHLWTPNGTQSVLGLFEDGRNYTCKGKRIADGVESLIGAFYLAGAAKEAALKATAAASGGGSREDVTSWVWHRVSRGGLVAAAAFCEAVRVLPRGAAKYLTGSPMSLPSKATNSSDINSLSLLHPSYSNYYRAKLGSIPGSDGGAGAAGFKVTLTDKLAERYSNRAKKLPGGPLPYTFRDPAWLLQSLTHVSVLGCASYQRLEFLGDALMDLLVSLRTLSAGREHHLDPAALTKARAKAVSNQMMATASVMSGLHLLLHANSWRLLVGVRRFARETLTLYDKLPGSKNQSAGDGVRTGDLLGSADASAADRSATAAAIRLAANAGILSRAAVAAEAAGASKESVLAAAAAAASKAMAEAAMGALGAGAASLANRLSQDVLDDDTLWMAVWVRKKELAALQAAAAKAAKQAAAKAAAAGGSAPLANSAAGQDGNSAGADSVMTDAAAAAAAAAAAGSDEIAKELEQHMAAAVAEAAAEAQVTKRKFPKVLADLIESLTAAVYVDSGGDWEATWAVGEYLLCQHQEEVERIEAQQQQQQRQQNGAAEIGMSSDSDEDLDGMSDLLMLLPDAAEC